MKKLLPLTILILLWPAYIFGQTLEENFDVDVSAFVDVDGYSSITVVPSSTEVGLESDVTVTVVDGNSSPLENRDIRLFAEGDPASVSFTQTGITNSSGITTGKVSSSEAGAFNIRAIDQTFGQDILIQDSETLYVFPVPTPELESEPYYTKGTTNTLYWEEVNGLSIYEYYIQVGLDENFNTVVADSGWVNTTQDTFTSLASGKIYFYRIRARNEAGFTSAWSTPVFSVQDSVPPTVIPGKVEVIESEEGYVDGIEVNFDVVDDLTVASVAFYCLQTDGGLVDCGPYEVSGTSYKVFVPVEKLEKGVFSSLLDTYTFCVIAQDEAGNSTKECGLEVEIDESVIANDPTLTRILNSVIDWLNTVFKYSSTALSDTLDGLKLAGLQLYVIITIILFFIVSSGIVAGSVMVIPYFGIYLILEILRWLGLIPGLGSVGIAIDSVSNLPVKYSLYKVYNRRNVLVRWGITDSMGNIRLNLETGKYRILFYKPGYLFPSELTNEGYKGEFVNVSSKNPLKVKVPLDMVNLYKDERSRLVSYKRMTHFLKSISFFILSFGLAGAVRLYERSDTYTNLILLLLFAPAVAVLVRNIVKVKIDVPSGKKG
jgi:hypothetical protein